MANARMLPFGRMIFHSCPGALVLAVLLACAGAAPCPAQNAVRGPAAPPVPLTFKDGHAPAAQEAPAAQQPISAQGAAQNADAAPQPKFPNKDTAKNRQDYEMGTGTGSIQLGRDETTGDTVMRHNPPKKVQEPYPLEQQPINVWPVIPGGKGGGRGR